VLVTQRPPSLRSHGDHWVFPGGRVEPGETWVEAARREASEELGIARRDIEVIGQLDSHGPIITGYVVHVFVAVLAPSSEPDPDPSEVADIVVIPLSELRSPGRSFLAAVGEDGAPEVAMPGGPAPFDRRSPLRWYVLHDGHYLWGLQATILDNLLHHLTNDGQDLPLH
jgi:ADP-ribose pyrophosphatase YjhB (NUDIX family)